MVLYRSCREEQTEWNGESIVFGGRFGWELHKPKPTNFWSTAFLRSGVSEALVQHRTGHRSLEGLRKYKRITAEQELQVSSILSAPHYTPGNHRNTTCTKNIYHHLMELYLSLSLAGCSFSGCTINITINQPLPLHHSFHLKLTPSKN